jgi:hypothetical protein
MATYTYKVTSTQNLRGTWAVQNDGSHNSATLIVAQANDSNLEPYATHDLILVVRGNNASVVGSPITVTTP